MQVWLTYASKDDKHTPRSDDADYAVRTAPPAVHVLKSEPRLRAEHGERATAQVVKRLFIEHPSFSRYTFLWSLRRQKGHGVALLIRKTLMEVQPPPEVSYTLNPDSPIDVIEARVIKVSSVPSATFSVSPTLSCRR